MKSEIKVKLVLIAISCKTNNMKVLLVVFTSLVGSGSSSTLARTENTSAMLLRAGWFL